LLQKKYLNKTIIKIMQSMSISENNPASTPQIDPKMEQPVATASNKGRIAVLLLLGMVFLGAEWYILETMFDDSKPKPSAVKQGGSSRFFQCRPTPSVPKDSNPKVNPTKDITLPVTPVPAPIPQKVVHNNAEYDVFVVPMHKNKVKLDWNED
jgi:hypothetical protein